MTATHNDSVTPRRRVAWLAMCGCLVALVGLHGCASARWEKAAEPAAQSDPGSPARQSRSRSGNPPFYEVFGQRYYVMPSSQGYREQGVASWYGRKFHGKRTSSGAVYDMYAMTAAHKTLPLPTDVRVTNLRNGKSVVVKVNDRGPFVHDRIIDLSYAAARQLDMINRGTALVEVEAFSGAMVDPVPKLVAESPPKLVSFDLNPIGSARADEPPRDGLIRLYLQVGAFGELANAQTLQQRLEAHGLDNVVIRHDAAATPPLYRVRVGPIGDVDEYDALVDRIGPLQIDESHLVTEAAEPENPDLAETPDGAIPGS